MAVAVAVAVAVAEAVAVAVAAAVAVAVAEAVAVAWMAWVVWMPRALFDASDCPHCTWRRLHHPLLHSRPTPRSLR